MVKYTSIIKKLQKIYSGVADAIVVSNSGKILFSTKNWNVKGDIKGVRKKKGHLIGASTPD